MKYLVAFICLFSGLTLLAQAEGSNYKLVEWNASHPGYFEHLPDGYGVNPETEYPVIIFLHGMGERDMGNEGDLNRILRWGPPRIIAKNGSEYKAIHPYRFIVLAPQLKAPSTSWKAKEVDDFIKFAMENYSIDRERIYLTGISMGGNGVWNYASSAFNSPNKLAAIVPISGWGNTEKGCRIVEKGIPVWAFHGQQDNVVPYSSGKAMFTSLGKCQIPLDSKNYRFSPLNAEHTAWPPVYSSVSDSLSIYDWFMTYTLSGDTIINKSTAAWNAPPFLDVEPEQVGTLPSELNETSGLAVDSKGRLWSHNDSGNKAEIFEIETSGTVIRKVHIAYSQNTDWEDIATDQEGNLYIGDIGNNLNVRKKLSIYKVTKTELEKENPAAETITFVYEDQVSFPPRTSDMHYDAESLIHYDGSLYIFTKNRTEPFTGYTHIYRIPDTPGDHTAQLVDSLKLGEGVMTNFWLTSADISPKGNHLALLSHDKIWILSCFQGKKFSEGRLTELRLNSYTQKEGVTFLDENTLIITDERIRNILGGSVYRLNLPDELNKSCD